ncbi:membrane magnesium transporter 1-like [Teleopsis dalmanni]|uniref:membrane magnesium transporter 1-like n=1 Tax=Teleopsis dalmanni TaxID=139649 RepID=UPI0018CCD31E|nr:membrane magnesium transporter 1-like [Teleopsis dalmanni]XP_037951541.1 membrane magnesium transporter 1-like [Teleopsis dalmanni]
MASSILNKIGFLIGVAFLMHATLSMAYYRAQSKFLNGAVAVPFDIVVRIGLGFIFIIYNSVELIWSFQDIDLKTIMRQTCKEAAKNVTRACLFEPLGRIMVNNHADEKEFFEEIY